MSLATRSILALHLAAAVVAQQPGESWWAYQPLQRPDVPAVANAAWPRSPVDEFVLARLEAAGLQPSPMADRYTLLRRLTYDLTGLPPTPADVAAFADDDAPDAYDKVVDRLLASPQYGVKWGRHWLDLVRYAETDGYERDRQKPYVWRYRDWVVDAFNADMPYGDFLRRQLAGDELAGATVADHIATGYYRLGIWDDEPTEPLQARYDALDGVVDTTGRVMLGISMGCARCHDHKKDPLPQRDYYSFLAFFENLTTYDLRAHPMAADGAEARYRDGLAAYEGKQAVLVGALRDAAAAAWQEVPGADRDRLVAAADTGLVARYSGDDLRAQELHDSQGDRHGRIEGQVVQVDGRHGGAMRFDGDDAAVLPRLVEDSFTVSFFVRSKHRGSGRAGDTRWFTGDGLVDGEVSGIVRDWGIAWHGEGRIVAGIGAPETFLASPTGYHDGEWHHVALVRDQASGHVELYVDGVMVGRGTGNKDKLDAPPRLVVGRLQPGGHGFRGDLDELRFYDRALQSAEVASLALDLPGGIAAPAIMQAMSKSGGEGAGHSQLFTELATLVPPEFETVDVLAVREQGAVPAPSFVRVRGMAQVKGDRVEPGYPQMLGMTAPVFDGVPPDAISSRRRSTLARWITEADNPLTWRVIANRLWQYHFGRGLVRSANDFGRLGELPTHPRLLDWLACEVVAQNGSLKAMHRLLVTSAAYRMVSAPVPAAAAVDPQNDLLWRFDRRRLTAEEVRDTIIDRAGDLELQLGGPWVYPPLPAQVLATASRPDAAWGRSTPQQARRRSLYVHIKRSLQEPLLATFDQADTDNSCPVRFATVQASQALVLINGDFAQMQARRFAARLQREAATAAAQLALGLELVTQRPCRAPDRERLLALHRDLMRDHGRTADEALQRCCLVLLNCNEMIYID